MVTSMLNKGVTKGEYVEDKDRTPGLLKQTSSFIKQLAENCEIPTNITQKRDHVSECYCPRLYALPKIHKDPIAPRPILAHFSSPTHNMSKWLATILRPFSTTHTSTLQSARQMAHFIQHFECDKADLFSFDVVAMYPSVPVDLALESLHNRLIKGPIGRKICKENKIKANTILKMVKHCLSTTRLYFCGRIFTQSKGVAMRNPLAPIIAEIMMQKIQTQAFSSLSRHQQPLLFKRYVDDCFIICHKSHVETILNALNAQHSTMQLTMEHPHHNGSIDFLDLNICPVYMTDKMKFTTTVFRKKTHTSHLLAYSSAHPPTVKQGIASCFLHRASSHCSTKDLLLEEHNKIADNLKLNQYPPAFIKRAIDSAPTPSFEQDKKDKTPIQEETTLPTFHCSIPFVPHLSYAIRRSLRKVNVQVHFKTITLQQILSKPKDPPPPSTSSVVYEIACSCNQIYIGETSKPLADRIKQHQYACRSTSQFASSALAAHLSMNNTHTIQWDEAKILFKANSKAERKTAEALFILTRQPQLNRREELGWQVSSSWRTLLARRART